MDNIIDVNNPMQSMQTSFALMSNAFKKHYFTPTNNQRISSNTRNKRIAQPAMNMNHDRQMHMVVVNDGNQGNRQMFYNCKGLGHYARDCANRARVRDSTYYNERLMLVQQVEAEIPLTAEQHDFLVVDSDEEWEEGELNANCIFMTKLQATSTNTDNNHVYDTVTPYEVLNFDNYYDNRIYNMFSHEEQHSELPESSQGTYVEQHYDSNIMVETIDVDFSGGDVKQYAVNNEETNAYCETLLNNFKVEIDRINMPHADTEKVVHKETIGLLVCNEDQELTQARARGWYLATRCTVHVCNSRDMFVDYEPVTGHEVILDNNSHVDVVGFGTVMLPLTTGKVLTLENVFHIPTITKCLISVVKLTDIGFGVSFGGDQCAINKGRNVIGKGYKEDGLYRLSVLEENSGVKVVHDETISLIVSNESPELTKSRARGWVLSTACTVHVCNSRDMFVDYHPLNGHEADVLLGGRAEVAGVGTVKLRLATGKVWTLRNVFHMPIIIKCILSFSKLGQSNLITSMSMSDEGCELRKGDEIVGTAYKEGGLLRLSLVDERQDGIEGSE
ncbi:putative reverse transcriptase, RNA-dependent DNA polymerase, LTR copia-type gag-polypeptide [Tanacetum coccineum]